MANQFLPFGLAINANVLTQAAWAADTERMVGFRIGPGLAIKANTAWRQSMFVSAAIAQLVADVLDEDVIDHPDHWPVFISQLRRMMIEVTGGPDAPDDGRKYVRMYRQWVLGDDWFLPLVGGTMTGFITLHARAAMDWHAVPKIQLDDEIRDVLNFLRGNYLPLAGTDHPDVIPPRMRGFITLHAPPVQPMHAANKQYVDDSVGDLQDWVIDNYLPLAGGTMRGFITLHAEPQLDMHPVNLALLNRRITELDDIYLRLTGGTLYRPGGSHFFEIRADPNQWATTLYNVSGARRWIVGTAPSGSWFVHDADTNAFRQIINPPGIGAAATEFWSPGHSVSLALYGRSYDDDNYIRLYGANDWLFGPQGGRGRFLFYNGADRFAIYDNGSISVGWDAHVAATVFTGYVNANEQVTTQRLWVWGYANIEGLGITGTYPGQGYGLMGWTRAGFWDGIDMWGGQLHVTNALVANTWGGVQVHGGLSVISSDAWFNSWRVTMDQDLVVGHAICLAPQVGTPLMCGFVSAPGLWATSHIYTAGYVQADQFLSTSGNVNAFWDINCGRQVTTQALWVGDYARIQRLDVIEWLGSGGGLLDIVTPARANHHFYFLTGCCFWGVGAQINATMNAMENANVFFSHNVAAAGQWLVCDERFKSGTTEVERDALTAVREVKFYEYDTIYQGQITDHENTGMTAQQIAEAIPDAVCLSTMTAEHDEEAYYRGEPCASRETDPYMVIRLMPMLAYSMRAIQQLADRNDALEARLAELEGRSDGTRPQ